MNIGSWKIISHGGTTISFAAMLLFFHMVNCYDFRNQHIHVLGFLAETRGLICFVVVVDSVLTVCYIL